MITGLVAKLTKGIQIVIHSFEKEKYYVDHTVSFQLGKKEGHHDRFESFVKPR